MCCGCGAGGSRAAAASLLARLHELAAAEEELAGHSAALRDAQARLQAQAAAGKEHARCAAYSTGSAPVVPRAYGTLGRSRAAVTFTDCARDVLYRRGHDRCNCIPHPQAPAWQGWQLLCATGDQQLTCPLEYLPNGTHRTMVQAGACSLSLLTPCATVHIARQTQAGGGAGRALAGPAAGAHRRQRERAAGGGRGGSRGRAGRGARCRRCRRGAQGQGSRRRKGAPVAQGLDWQCKRML